MSQRDISAIKRNKLTKGDEIDILDKAFMFNINKNSTFFKILVECHRGTRGDKGWANMLLMTTERTSDDEVLIITSSILLKPQKRKRIINSNRKLLIGPSKGCIFPS